jgi:hypothetical protein
MRITMLLASDDGYSWHASKMRAAFHNDGGRILEMDVLSGFHRLVFRLALRGSP